MLCNCEGIFACMLLVPVLLNILVPLALLAGWLVKHMVTVRSRLDRGDDITEQGSMPIPA